MQQLAMAAADGTVDARSRLLTMSAMISLALHASVAATLVLKHASNDLGSIEEKTEAISVELVLSSVIEQSAVATTSDAASADATVAATPGAVQEEATPKEELRNETKPEADQKPVATEEQVPAITATADDATAPSEKLEPVAEPAQKQDRKPAAKPAVDGGAASRATAGERGGSARASASTGDVLAYAARVRARVAGNRPSGRGFRGRAVVAFGVTSGGGLAYVALRQSSGSPVIDQAALAAVRRSSPFPAPPPGTPANRLTFSVPFIYQ